MRIGTQNSEGIPSLGGKEESRRKAAGYVNRDKDFLIGHGIVKEK